MGLILTAYHAASRNSFNHGLSLPITRERKIIIVFESYISIVFLVSTNALKTSKTALELKEAKKANILGVMKTVILRK